MELNKCNLSIEFYFNDIDNQIMSVEILPQGEQGVVISKTGVYIYRKEITLPTKVSLKFTNKNLQCDTILDETGKIIKDKSVIIQHISIDGIPISIIYLKNHLKIITDDQREVYSNYVGFNGEMLLDFDCANVFLQMMKFNRLI
jgi:hypothetical protein